MAREKRPPHKSPSSLSDAYRDIPMLLAREANTPARQQALLNASIPSETPIPTDWVTPQILEAKKPRRQRELEKVDRILTDKLAGKSVSARDLEWATNVAELEQEMMEQEQETEMARQMQQEAEHEESSTVLSGSDINMWVDDMGGTQMETADVFNAALGAEDTTGLANLEAARESALRSPVARPDDSGSELSSSVSDVSALNPDRSPRKGKTPVRKQRESARQASKKRLAEQAAAEREEVEATVDEVPDPVEVTLSNALSTLKYDENPPDRPYWLTGLNKPLPHPSLTALQDFEIQTRFWVDEIDRLKHLRSKLSTPAGRKEEAGEWHYDHFGSTQAVIKRENRKRVGTMARGLWTWEADGEAVERKLDEYPMSLEGEPLGWTAKNWEHYQVKGKPEYEDTEVRVGKSMGRGIGGLDGADERDMDGKLRREEEDFSVNRNFDDASKTAKDSKDIGGVDGSDGWPEDDAMVQEAEHGFLDGDWGDYGVPLSRVSSDP